MGSFPDYDNLQVIEINGKQKRCAWGVFDKEGEKDVTEGVTISLNWPMRVIKKPGFGRKGFVHRVISFVNSPLQIHGFDDEVEFNTQCSSQWDALCHFYDQDFKRGYNDANPSIQDLTQDYGEEDVEAKLPTLNHWHRRGGLATRGVLIDYKAYADRHGIKYSPFTPHKISISTVEAIAKEQNIQFQQGDVFLLRTGYTEALEAAQTVEEQDAMANSPDSVGIEDTLDAVKWFWNKHFSAVAADNIGFEVMRPTVDGVDGVGTTADYLLHPHFLSLLGLHIGELWDLKALSKYCHESGRFTFFLTSVPLNYAGAVGSPANAMAMF